MNAESQPLPICCILPVLYTFLAGLGPWGGGEGGMSTAPPSKNCQPFQSRQLR